MDSYTNAISDIYQDNFDEGIFTGKGIYDLEIFHKVLFNEIPENTVLSHDLLEGSYLKCGLATDILVLDDYPSRYSAYFLRQARWIRGDFQIAQWLKNTITIKNKTKKKNPLGILSKFKILDNLRRSMLPIFVLLSIILLKDYKAIIIAMTSYVFSAILDIINYIVFKEGKDTRFIYAHKSFMPNINSVKASIIRGILEISFLPHKAYYSASSIIKTIYRMNVSKKHLLEWITAEKAEAQAKTDLFSYYKFMSVNLALGVLNLVSGVVTSRVILIALGILWLMGPLIAWYISKDIKIKKPIEKISKQDIEYLLNTGKKIWQYFKDNINEENNFLPPDNYQEDRMPKVASRTSTTNIGLGILSIISSYDLKYINLEEALDLINKMLNTITKLQKWNGHLYNWYNTKTLEPLMPRYISTVDNGNFIGYLYTTKQFLQEVLQKLETKKVVENFAHNRKNKYRAND